MSSPLRFGIVSGAPRAAHHLDALCAALSRRLGRTVAPVVAGSFGELKASLLRGDLELAWSQPIAAVRFELEHVAAISVGIYREGGSSYSSALFTRASSSIATLEDLRGKRVAWVDEESAAGYVLPRAKLRSAGVGPEDLGAQTFEGTHEGVVRAVLEGRADAGATHVAFEPVSGTIESAGWFRTEGDDAVRILATTGPIPPDVIVVSLRLEDMMHERIGEALLEVARHEPTSEHVHALFAGRGFVLVGSYQYDALRAIVARERQR